MIKPILRACMPTVGMTYVSLMLLAWTCIHCGSGIPGKVAVAGIDAVVCVLNHAQESISQIVRDCDGVVAEDVVKILDAHRAAELREAGAK